MSAKQVTIRLSMVLVAALAAGGACRKQDEAAGGGTAAQPAPDAAPASAAADGGVGDAVSGEPSEGGCPMAKGEGGPHEGCPHHAAGGEAGKPGGCPMAAAASGTAAGGCPHAAAAAAAAAGGCPHAAAAGGTPPDPVPVTSMGPLNLPVKTAGELAPERIGQEEICPIGGDKFTVTAETPAVQHEGQVRLFGCMGCAVAFAENPQNPEPPPCPHHAH